MLSSDIGHWDVVDMTEVLEEAYELVEEGVLSDDDLRDFLFTNPARMFGQINPDFFAGTSCETEVSNSWPRTGRADQTDIGARPH